LEQIVNRMPDCGFQFIPRLAGGRHVQVRNDADRFESSLTTASSFEFGINLDKGGAVRDVPTS
jgi:hypothetical protein